MMYKFISNQILCHENLYEWYCAKIQQWAISRLVIARHEAILHILMRLLTSPATGSFAMAIFLQMNRSTQYKKNLTRGILLIFV